MQAPCHRVSGDEPNADVAARVARAIDRDVKYHAKKPETTEETNKRGPEVEEASEERKAKEPRNVEAAPASQTPFRENESHTPTSSSQAPSSSKVKTKFETKRKEVKTRVGDATGSASGGITPTPEDPHPQNPVVPVASRVYHLPSGGTVRLRPRGPEDGEDRGS